GGGPAPRGEPACHAADVNQAATRAPLADRAGVPRGKTRFTVRRILEDRRREVLCLRADALFRQKSAPSAPIGPNSKGAEEIQWRTDENGVRQWRTRRAGVRRHKPCGKQLVRRDGALGALANSGRRLVRSGQVPRPRRCLGRRWLVI